MEHIAAISETESFEMAEAALALGRKTGYVDTYRYRLAENDVGCYVLFLDCSENFNAQTNVLWIIFAVFIFISLVLFTFF